MAAHPRGMRHRSAARSRRWRRIGHHALVADTAPAAHRAIVMAELDAFPVWEIANNGWPLSWGEAETRLISERLSRDLSDWGAACENPVLGRRGLACQRASAPRDLQRELGDSYAVFYREDGIDIPAD